MFIFFSDVFLFFIFSNLIILLLGLFSRIALHVRILVKGLYIKFYTVILIAVFVLCFFILLSKLSFFNRYFFLLVGWLHCVVFFFILLFVVLFLFFFFFVDFNTVKILPVLLCLSFTLFSNVFYLFIEDFFSVYIVLEFHTLLLYILYNITLKMYSGFYVKNGIKFFILSVFTSLFLLLGLFLIYFACGTIVFSEISVVLDYQENIIFKLGLNLVYGVFSFKLGLFPLYVWMLEIFGILENIFFIIYVFLSKIPIFFMVLKLIFFFDVSNLLVLVCLFSIIYGIFSVLVENDLRLFIVYSSLVQYAVLLLAMSEPNLLVFYGIFYTYLNYVLVFNLIFFFFLFLTKQQNFSLFVFINLKYTTWFLSIFFIVIIFSVIGVPPTLGFLGKFHMYYGLLLADALYRVFFLILVSLSTSVYYFNIIRLLYFTPIKDANILLGNVPVLTYTAAVCCLSLVLFSYFVV